MKHLQYQNIKFLDIKTTMKYRTMKKKSWMYNKKEKKVRKEEIPYDIDSLQ